MTLVALGLTSTLPAERPFGLVAAAVLIAPTIDRSPQDSRPSGRAEIGTSVGIAVMSVLLVAGSIISLLWWRRRKMRAIPMLKSKQNDGFELLSK